MNIQVDPSCCCLHCSAQPAAWCSVSSNLLRCTSCDSASYCSPVCERADSKNHQIFCETIQRADENPPSAPRPLASDWETYERMLSLPIWKAASAALQPDPRHRQVLVVKLIAEPPRTPFDQPSQLLNLVSGAVVPSSYLIQHLNWAGLTRPGAQSFLEGLVTRQQHLEAGKSKYLVVLLIRTGHDESARWYAVGAGLGELGGEEDESAEPIAEAGSDDWFETLARDMDAAKGTIKKEEEQQRLKTFPGGAALVAAS